MVLRIEKADGISYYICGRRKIIRALGPGGTGWRNEQAKWGTQGENSRRAPDSLLEGNTYYRFWVETGRVIPVQIMTNV